MSELKPCPFCGGEAICNDSHSHTTVSCDCDANPLVSAPSDDEAIVIWNRRVPMRESSEILINNTAHQLKDAMRFLEMGQPAEALQICREALTRIEVQPTEPGDGSA